MARIIWTTKALQDLENLLLYISRDAPLTARRFAQRLVHRVEALQENPFLGGYIAEDSTRTYRELLQGNYRIIYRTDGNTIYIATIYHAARLLQEDDLL